MATRATGWIGLGAALAIGVGTPTRADAAHRQRVYFSTGSAGQSPRANPGLGQSQQYHWTRRGRERYLRYPRRATAASSYYRHVSTRRAYRRNVASTRTRRNRPGVNGTCPRCGHSCRGRTRLRYAHPTVANSRYRRSTRDGRR